MLSLRKVKSIEKKWNRLWEREKVFESNPSKKKKFFLTIPYPYLNGSPHIGHSFSFFRGDSYARFKRLEGYNVLFPQSFHATGEPILGTIERVRQGDEIQIETFRHFGATTRDIKNFVKYGAEYTAKYWMEKWIEILKLAGFSIDWRRTFVTAILPRYSKFIEWQYRNLRKRGFVTQGTHPVIWCPKCKSPTGDHDRLKGVGESPIEFTLIKFRLESGEVLPCATLRPETVYGVTNIWINPSETYVWCKVNGEIWLLSEQAIEKLSDQLKKITPIGKIKGENLIGKHARNPVLKNKIPILPAEFVDVNVGSGIVMSVPAHAPYDWIALQEVKRDRILAKRHGLEKIRPISLIKVEGFSEYPAIDVCKRYGIKSQRERDKLDKVTEEIYRKEYHIGKLKHNVGKYAGKRISEVKDELIRELKQNGFVDSIWETTNPVVCRCTTPCHVKILEKQWFLKFSDENWKERVKACVRLMKFYPEEVRQQFLNTVDWLHNKACTRKTGLGTKLPWDREWIVETLGDSTIYMALYTIWNELKKVPVERLCDEIFDFVFLGKGNAKKVSRKTGVALNLLKKMRKEFTYFYPVDLRTSGKDLVQNHLTFYLFHHTAIWSKKYWPKAVAVNGFVKVEGEKMSKSLGNVLPLYETIKKFGSDLVRINIISSAEGLDDANWSEENVKVFLERFKFFFYLAKNLKKANRKSVENVDKYLLSRMQKTLVEARELFENLRFRTATQLVIFGAFNELKWYLDRVGGIRNANKLVLKKYLVNLTKILSPLAPHLAEELWEILGRKRFVFQGGYPKINPTEINEYAELREEFVRKVIEDVREIEKITRIKPKVVYLIIAPAWKFKVYKTVLKKKVSIKDLLEKFKPKNRDEFLEYVKSLFRRINQLTKTYIEKDEQFEILKEAESYLRRKFKCKLIIRHAGDVRVEKAKRADVTKPAIYVL